MIHTMSGRWLLGLGLVLACAAPGRGEKDGARNSVDAALEASQETGAPVLAIAMSDTCVPCAALKKRLSTDPDLQSVVWQFVPLELNVKDESWKQWSRRFGSGDGVPHIYIIRADGETLYSESGAPKGDALLELLVRTRDNAGKSLTEAQGKRLKTAIQKAEGFIAEGNTARTLEVLMAASVPDTYAKAALDAREIVDKLKEEAQERVTAADVQLADGATALAGAISLGDSSPPSRRPARRAPSRINRQIRPPKPSRAAPPHQRRRRTASPSPGGAAETRRQADIGLRRHGFVRFEGVGKLFLFFEEPTFFDHRGLGKCGLRCGPFVLPSYLAGELQNLREFLVGTSDSVLKKGSDPLRPMMFFEGFSLS